MSARLGLGTDTAFLQGVDSRIRRARTNEALFDPHDQVSFIHAVDLYADTVPFHLVLPRDTPGYLATAGATIASAAEVQARGEYLVPLTDARGISLYGDFFQVLAADEDLLQQVTDWAWFQLFDPDVLRGYSSRMDVESVYLTPAIDAHFDAAVITHSDIIRALLVGMGLHCSARYGYTNDPVRTVQDRYGVRQGATYDAAQAIEQDVDHLTLTEI